MINKKLAVHLPTPHSQKQDDFINSTAKRIIVRAGRRWGKTVGVAERNIKRFLAGRRQLYATPTSDQLGRWWSVVTRALAEPIAAGVYYKNETEHLIELKGTEQRIRGKTAWNADSLRGDYADDLTFDEWQLMDEEAWDLVGAPMLLDNDGDAVFIYTPPSLHSRSVSKARDPQHAAKMYKRYFELMQSGNQRYMAMTATSHENITISKEALEEIIQDMTSLAYRMEILAQDIDEAPGALWTREIIERNRVLRGPVGYKLVVVGVDPSATSTGDEAGIVVDGLGDEDCYVIEDASIQGSPKTWAEVAVTKYYAHKANLIIAESNNGGEMVESVIHQIDEDIPVELVHASRGKQTRAEPISAMYEKNKVHHIGNFPALEDEMCLWCPGDTSPNRMDAHVWAMTKLKEGRGINVTSAQTKKQPVSANYKRMVF